MEMTLSEQLAGFACAPETGAPGAVREAAVRHALDALGCGLAASALGVANAGQIAATSRSGGGPCSGIGIAAGLSATDAALANGMLIHALDFDDTHAGSICHVSAVVVPAALACAEAEGSDGAALLDALIVGSEIVTRLGAAGAGEFHRRGLHPTAICGVFGAAAACARLRGLDAATTVHAVGIAGSMAAGLMAYLDDGTQTKPVHAGWAAHAGGSAVELAACGAEGPASVLEGRFGLFAALLGRRDLAAGIGDRLDLGDRWELPDIAFKPYPCCHFIHGCLAAGEQLLANGLDVHEGDRRGAGEGDALDVRAREGFDVLVRVPADAVGVVLEPFAHKVAPRTRYEAQFSLPWSLAALLLTGRLDLATYAEPTLSDPAIRALASRVRYEQADFASYPGAFPGAVVVGGAEVVVAYQPGSPQRPLADGAVPAKFRANAGLALGDLAAVEALERSFERLEAVENVAEGLAPLRAARAMALAARPAGRAGAPSAPAAVR